MKIKLEYENDQNKKVKQEFNSVQKQSQTKIKDFFVKSNKQLKLIEKQSNLQELQQKFHSRQKKISKIVKMDIEDYISQSDNSSLQDEDYQVDDESDHSQNDDKQKQNMDIENSNYLQFVDHDFQSKLLEWYDLNGRKNLPWQLDGSPYKTWISEIMLQQTQVKTVIPFFKKFIQRFPDVQSLANASEEDVLSLWQGLGYYSRARNLHKSSKMVVEQFQGIIPQDLNNITKLIGVGKSTGGAILSLGHGLPFAILDANVKRVLARVYGLKGRFEKNEKQLWEIAEKLISQHKPKDHNQALMDIGALICTDKNPTCSGCPFKSNCYAYNFDCIDEIPGKKEKKIKKSQQWFLLQQMSKDSKKVALIQRPGQGIWAKLFCLPIFEQKIILNKIIKHLDQSTQTIKHEFSHFTVYLNISRVSSDELLVENSQWFDLKILDKVGLPRPIKLLLES